MSDIPSNILQIASQFTDNSVATTASECQRDICKTIIQPGEARFYVADHGNPDRPGRYICGPCMQHYMTKLATTARIQSRTSIAQGMYLASKNIIEC